MWAREMGGNVGESPDHLYYFVGTDKVGLADMISVEKALLKRNPDGKLGRRNGYKTVWFSPDLADPVSRDLERKGIMSFSRNPEDGSVPTAIIVSVGLRNGPYIERWSRFALAKGAPLMWLEGAHGASVGAAVRHIPAGTICVFDAVAAAAVRRARAKATVVVCGKPSLRENSVFVEQRESVRARVRNLLGVGEDERLGCVFLDAVTGKTIDAFMRALVHMKRVPQVRWSVRLSPSLSPQSAKKCRTFLLRSGVALTIFDQSYPLDVAHAADVVVADGSHEVAYVAAALGTPTVVYLPEVQGEDPPHVAAEAVHAVRGDPANVPSVVCLAMESNPPPGQTGLGDLLAPDAAKRVVRCLLARTAQEENEQAA